MAKQPKQPQTDEEILKGLKDLAKFYRFYRSMIRYVFIPVIIITGILPVIFPPDGGYRANFSNFAPILFTFVALMSRTKIGLQRAAELKDLKYVGCLAQCADFSDKDVAAVVRSTLTELLPVVDPVTAATFTKDQQKAIVDLLRFEKDRKLIDATIDYLRNNGGSEAVDRLERFKEHASSSNRQELKELGDHALSALPDIRMRLAKTLIAESEARTAETELEQVKAQQILNRNDP